MQTDPPTCHALNLSYASHNLRLITSFSLVISYIHKYLCIQIQINKACWVRLLFTCTWFHGWPLPRRGQFSFSPQFVVIWSCLPMGETPQKFLSFMLTSQLMLLFVANVPVKSIQSFVDGSFCPTWSHSHSVPNKYTEAYINYKLLGLLFSYNLN